MPRLLRMNDAAISLTARSGTVLRGASPAAAHRRSIVFVLGMPGSGASLCSQALRGLDVDILAAPVRHEPTRPDAAAEDRPTREIAEAHERLLARLEGSDPFLGEDFSAWGADPQVAELRRLLAGSTDLPAPERSLGFDDPRLLRLMPLWGQLAAELRLETKIVFCLRQPAAVAEWLQSSEGIDRHIGEARWFCYVLDFFRQIGDREFCLIDYDDWRDRQAANLSKLRRFLGIRPGGATRAMAGLTVGQMDDEEPLRIVGDPLIGRLYRLARRADGDRDARAAVQEIAAHFAAFDRVHAALRRDRDPTAAAVAGRSNVAQEAALRAAFVERDEMRAELGSLRRRLAAAEQVGKDLLAALQAHVPPPLVIDRRPWWRRRFRRPAKPSGEAARRQVP